MKFYVIPVETKCQGKCDFCITKHRPRFNSEFLNIKKLDKINSFKNIDKIEITGGGEPSLHPDLENIIKICSKFNNSSIYTNGYLNPSIVGNTEIVVSRVHYNDKINEKIMGVKYNFNKFKKL